MELISAYGHALASVALWIIVVQGLSAWAGAAKAKAGVAPGGTPTEDYANQTYRIHRAYQNSVDNLAVFAAAVAVSVLAGASPFWVNLLASVAVLLRIAMVYVHVKGIGKPVQGLRSTLYVIHWGLIVIITLFGLIAAF